MRFAIIAVALVGSVHAISWPFGSKTITAATPAEAYAVEKLSLEQLEQLIWNDEHGIEVPEPAPSPVIKAAPVKAIPTSKPVVPYTGLQYTFNTRIGALRIRPGLTEAFFLLALALYAGLGLLGAKANRTRADKWAKAHQAQLEAEFSAFGLEAGKRLVKDNGDKYILYASGRRGVESLKITIQTAPYHDILKMLYHALRQIADPIFVSGSNTVTLDFILRDTPAKFVYAIAAKQGLYALRNNRWDLATFTALIENPTAIAESSLHPTLISMFEHSEVEFELLSHPVDLGKNLREHDLSNFLSLSVSDMPTEFPEPKSDKPEDDKPVSDQWRITLSLKLPHAGDEKSTVPFVASACNLVDVLHTRTNLVGPLAQQRLKQNRARKLSAITSGTEQIPVILPQAARKALPRTIQDRKVGVKAQMHAQSTKASAAADKAWAEEAFENLRTKKQK